MFILNFDTLHKTANGGQFLDQVMNEVPIHVKIVRPDKMLEMIRPGTTNTTTSFSRNDPCQTDKTAQVHKMATQLLVRVEC